MARLTEPALRLLQAVHRPDDPEGGDGLRFITDHGTMDGRHHPAPGDAAVLWLFGAGGGLNGPAGGLYPRLAKQLQPHGVASLEIAYRRAGHLADCIADALLGITWLAHEGKRRIVLVGHSFGGAVVVSAGVANGASVVGVAALSSQTSGTSAVSALSPIPLLLIHGTADEVLPPTCSRDLYERAKQPKQLIFYPGCRHGLDECRDQLDRDLLRWLRQVLSVQA